MRLSSPSTSSKYISQISFPESCSAVVEVNDGSDNTLDNTICRRTTITASARAPLGGCVQIIVVVGGCRVFHSFPILMLNRMLLVHYNCNAHQNTAQSRLCRMAQCGGLKPENDAIKFEPSYATELRQRFGTVKKIYTLALTSRTGHFTNLSRSRVLISPCCPHRAVWVSLRVKAEIFALDIRNLCVFLWAGKVCMCICCAWPCTRARKWAMRLIALSSCLAVGT